MSAPDAPGAAAGGGSPLPSGTELVRAFLPTLDLEHSKRFYLALGFELLFEGEVAVFAAGSGGFVLQRYFHPEWAANCMMQLIVDDLDAWWARLEVLDVAAAFAVAPPTPPALQPWGLRVAYVVDPAGVLWHVVQR